MASGAGATLARRIMAMAVKGQHVPRNVQEAAERVQLGQGSAQDVTEMRAFLGQRRGRRRGRGGRQASFAQQAQEQVQFMGQTFAALSREASILEARGAGASASDRARFVGETLGAVERFTKTKLARNVAEKVAGLFSSSPTLAKGLLNGLRVASKVGGPVAMIAAAGFDVAEHLLASRQQAGRAQSAGMSFARENNINPAQRQALEDYHRRRFDANRGVYQIYDWIAPGAREESIQKAASEDLATQVMRREHLRQRGIDPAEALANYAAAQGKPVEYLQPHERDRALDVASRMHALEGGAKIEEKIKQQAELNVDAQLTGSYWGKWAGQYLTSDGTRREMIETQRRVLFKKEEERIQQAIKDKAYMNERMRADRTPAETLQLQREQEIGQRLWQSTRNRRRAWSNI